MQQSCWNPVNDTGFLMSPDPVFDLSIVGSGLPLLVSTTLEHIADSLPELIKSGNLRNVIDELEAYDVSALRNIRDFRVVERAFQIYAHLANAYVWCDEENPKHHIPEGVAVPLVELSKMVERPPILPYAATSLCNFRRRDPHDDLVADNLECIIKFVDIPDESWFHLIHVEIEAHAANALKACVEATSAISSDDAQMVKSELATIPEAFGKMMATFKRMDEHCSPEVYFHTSRPYRFGFDDVVYRGVEDFNGRPQTFCGETGEQSTVVPALKAFLGLQNEQHGLSEPLEVVKPYMPSPHRQLLAGIDSQKIRKYVVNQKSQSLKQIYNNCLEGLFEFRSLHFNMLKGHVACKVKNPIGRGGTDFMHWLQNLRNETAAQYI
ncbi:MAG: hypothetical protein AAF434_11365 [Pseudomonadota bacterium]